MPPVLYIPFHSIDKKLLFVLSGLLQVQNLNLPGSDYFQKLTLLKREKGGLSAEDEKRFRDLRRYTTV